MLTIPIDVEEHEVEGILLCICIMFSASSVATKVGNLLLSQMRAQAVNN